MNDPYAATISDENFSTETTPNIVTEKLKAMITENIVNASSITTPNSEIPNTPPIIKQKLPKLPITAGKPLR